jgi:Ring finger domain
MPFISQLQIMVERKLNCIRLCKEELKQIPIVKYSGDGPTDGFGFDTVCAICLDSFEVGDTLRILPNCNHSFHRSCIDPWLLGTDEDVVTSICPTCRQNATHTPPPISTSPPIEHDIAADTFQCMGSLLISQSYCHDCVNFPFDTAAIVNADCICNNGIITDLMGAVPSELNSSDYSLCGYPLL